MCREDVENVLDRINKIDRIRENIADPQIGTNLHKSICGDKCGFVDCNSVEKLTQSSQSPQSGEKETSRTSRTSRELITQTAQAILDAHALYPDSSLADLYDPLTMPIELRKAHAANDAAVMSVNFGDGPQKP